MSSVGHYLEKHALFPALIPEKPHPDLFISIVIPCFDELDLFKTLNSLWQCERPQCAVEVIIVINSSSDSNKEALEQNERTGKAFSEWSLTHTDEKLVFFTIVKNNLPVKDAGVGLARKIGMDEAAGRFEILHRPNGIIVGFDADCTCSENYLCEIENLFQNNPRTNACSIQFEHPLKGNEYDDFIYNAVTHYELYLRYYVMALRRTGHPFAFQTIGSAFAVRAGVYCKQGGMNKRKAGEDFYFLQKVIPLGNYVELDTAKVFPSPRTSGRVPFGTGAAIQKMKLTEDFHYKTYDIAAFDDISEFIKNIENLFAWDEVKIIAFQQSINEPLKSFLINNNFMKEVLEIKQNAITLISFSNRFFRWFNAFKVLKYMNYSHENFYSLMPVTFVANEFLQKHLHINEKYNPEELLIKFREISTKKATSFLR